MRVNPRRYYGVDVSRGLPPTECMQEDERWDANLWTE